MGNLLLAPLTFGFTFLLMWILYQRAPRRVWLVADRLHADRSLPKDGVSLGDIETKVVWMKFFFIRLNRFVHIIYHDDDDSECMFKINQLFYGRASIDSLIEKLRTLTRIA